MGLFSSKKKTYVSSVVYPLGEDDGPKKQEFLKYTVLNATMTQAPSLGDAITSGYLKGQGMALRNSFLYARTKYTEGLPTSMAKYVDVTSKEILSNALKHNFPDSEIILLTLLVGTADFEWWAEQYLAQNYGYDRTTGLFDRPPAGVDADATIAYDMEPSGLVRILLMSNDGSTKVVSFRPGNGFKAMGDFVHCVYQARQVFDSGISTEIRPKNEGETDSVTVVETVTVRAGETQTKVVRTTVDVDETGPDAVVKTQTVTEVLTRPQYFMYAIGSAMYPDIDAWLSDNALTSPYYPAIPLRRDNKDLLSGSNKNTELYKTSKKLLKRVGIEIDDLGESLNSNANVKDIDYAFVVFGVALNNKSQEGKRYLHKFFQYLRGISSPGATKAAHEDWASRFAAGQENTPSQLNMVQVYSPKNRSSNYDVKIQWDYIDTRIVAGQAFPGARKSDVDISMSGTRTEYSFLNMEIKQDSSKLYVRCQLDENSYEEMEIAGLVYDNYIYDGKSVTITAYDAFHDPEEEGFIIPMNQQVLRSMSLRDVTDLSYQCCHLVLNCYQVVKQKWYQRGIFKVILMVVAIVLMYFYPPAGVAALKTAIAATFVVLSAVMVKLVAVLVYMMAMMIVGNILLKVSTKVFGEKWAALVAAVVTVVLAYATGGGSAAANQAQGSTLLSAQNLMTASSVLGKGYAGYVAAQTKGVMADITKLNEEFEKKFDELEKMTEKMLGTNTDLLDIQAMTAATYQLYFEPVDEFLTRTLLTGNDICEVTMGQIESLTEFGLWLPVIG